MGRKAKSSFIVAGICAVLFALLTFLVLKVDVQAVGPNASKIGLAGVNLAVNKFLGAQEIWQTITKVLGVLALLVGAGFAILGVLELIVGKSFSLVERDLVILGCVYIFMALFYAVFEVVVVNYRPMLVAGVLEASYPSSHTMLIVCILSTAMVQAGRRLSEKTARTVVYVLCSICIALTVFGRVASGMHWLTDVLAGLLLGLFLGMLYRGLCAHLAPKRRRRTRRIY